MSIGIFSGEINENIVESYYSGMLCRLYPKLSVLFATIRNENRDENHIRGAEPRYEVFCNVDNLYLKWGLRYKSLKKKLEKENSLIKRKIRIKQIMRQKYLFEEEKIFTTIFALELSLYLLFILIFNI